MFDIFSNSHPTFTLRPNSLPKSLHFKNFHAQISISIIIFGINSHQILTSLFKKKTIKNSQSILPGESFLSTLYYVTLSWRFLHENSPLWTLSSVERGERRGLASPGPWRKKEEENIPRFFTNIFEVFGSGIIKIG